MRVTSLNEPVAQGELRIGIVRVGVEGGAVTLIVREPRSSEQPKTVIGAKEEEGRAKEDEESKTNEPTND